MVFFKATPVACVAGRLKGRLNHVSWTATKRGRGISYTFFLFAVIGALSFLFIWTMVPETRGRTLEQLEEHFREKFGEAGSRGPETAGAK